MASGSELIRRIKEQIHEVDPREVHDASLNGNGRAPLLVDVREQHEFEESHIPGAIHVPRGHLESRIEGRVGEIGIDLTDQLLEADPGRLPFREDRPRKERDPLGQNARVADAAVIERNAFVEAAQLHRVP